MWKASELEKKERVRFENIIKMGLDFSSMMRLFTKCSNEKLYNRIVKVTAEKFFNANSREDFVDTHSQFCDWGIGKIVLAEKKRNGQIIKESKLASYGQIAKTLDVTLKAAIYYSHLPNCEKATEISSWLNAAVDTKMMAMLGSIDGKKYQTEIRPWPKSIEEVDDKNKYLIIQKIVRKFIEEKCNGKITPVQFDDIYWSKLNRRFRAGLGVSYLEESSDKP